MADDDGAPVLSALPDPETLIDALSGYSPDASQATLELAAAAALAQLGIGDGVELDAEMRWPQLRVIVTRPAPDGVQAASVELVLDVVDPPPTHLPTLVTTFLRSALPRRRRLTGRLIGGGR